jgi:hypothetical protein
MAIDSAATQPIADEVSSTGTDDQTTLELRSSSDALCPPHNEPSRTLFLDPQAQDQRVLSLLVIP